MNVKFINAYSQKIIYEKNISDESFIITMINNFVKSDSKPVYIKDFSNSFIKVEFVNWIKKTESVNEYSYILFFK